MLSKIMSAKSALKKLKKQSQKTEKKALKQLYKLSNNVGDNRAANNEWHSEVKDLSQEVLTSVVVELAEPLSPVISWFKEGKDTPQFVSDKKKKSKSVQSRSHSLFSIPLKSPACKKCPALANGTCKCAAKKFKGS